MKIITSLQNEEVKNVCGLHFTRERNQKKLFIAHGIRTISALLENKRELTQLYVVENELNQALQIANESLITQVSDQVLKKMSAVQSPSGMIAVFQMPSAPAPHLLTPGLVLANISDPGNMGTLIRTCAAFNIKSVVIIEGVDPYNPKVVQASAGTIGNVQLFSWTWHELLEHKGRLKLCALVVSGGASLESIDKNHALIVVGNEAHGIPQELLSDCDNHITIAMPGNTESLNAAVAGSLALYEIFKN